MGFEGSIYLPLDLWVDPLKSDSHRYSDRFLMDDFRACIASIRDSGFFLVPARNLFGYWHSENIASKGQETVFWNNKTFIKDGSHPASVYNAFSELFIEQETGYRYYLYPSTNNTTYVVEGTLIFEGGGASAFDSRVFLTASWPLRIARMVRRFRRGEVQFESKRTIEDYVQFLINEALDCADDEIKAQLDGEEIMFVESVPENLSNYFDVARLCDMKWLGSLDVEFALSEFRDHLRRQENPEMLALFTRELLILSEYKHLLDVEKVDERFSELEEILLANS